MVVDPVNFLLLNQVHISKLYNTTTMLSILNLFQENNLWQLKKLSTSKNYNILKYSRYAMEPVRSECSSTLRSSLTNALIHHLKPFFKEDVDINHIMLDQWFLTFFYPAPLFRDFHRLSPTIM